MFATIKNSSITFELEYDDNENFILRGFTEEKMNQIREILNDDVIIAVGSKVVYSGVNIVLSYAEVYEDETAPNTFNAILYFEDLPRNGFQEEIKSKLDYLSLMTGIDLENETEKVRTANNGGGHLAARNTQPSCDISETVFGKKQRCELLSTKAGSRCSNSKPLQGRDTNFLLLSGTLFEIQKGGVAA